MRQIHQVTSAEIDNPPVHELVLAKSPEHARDRMLLQYCMYLEDQIEELKKYVPKPVPAESL